MTDILTLAKPDALVSSEGTGPNLRAHLRFPSAQRLAEFLPAAAELGAAILPGQPRKLPPSFSAASIAFVDLKMQKQVLEFTAADQVISVEAGLTLAELVNIVSERQLWWPISAESPELTLAEIISSGDGGCFEHGFGGPRDLVLGMQVALASGDVIKCGGKVVKNVTGYDLSKLFIGSRSTLGLICSVHLRLFARPETSHMLLWMADSRAQLLEAADILLGSGLPLSVLELMDSTLIGYFAKSAKQLQDLAKTTSCRACALLIQAHGHRSFVDEMLSAVSKLLPSSPNKPIDIPQPEADALLSKLSATNGYSVQIALPFSRFDDFISKVPLAQDCFWQARPGRGRLQLHLEGPEQVQPTVERIYKWAENSSQSAIVGFSDEEKEYRVVRYPEDAAAEALKLALKARYDPRGCLNPLVSV